MSIKTSDMGKANTGNWRRQPTLEQIKRANKMLDEADEEYWHKKRMDKIFHSKTLELNETALEEHSRRMADKLYKATILGRINDMDEREHTGQEKELNTTVANQAMTDLVEYLESDTGQVVVRAFNGGLDNGEISKLNENEMRIILRLRVLMEALDF